MLTNLHIFMFRSLLSIAIRLSAISSTSAAALVQTSEQQDSWNITLGPASSAFKDSTSHINAASDASESYSCSVTAKQGAELTYGPEFPNQLKDIIWSGTGTVDCTKLMSSIAFTIWAIDPQGKKIPIAAANPNPCDECAIAQAKDKQEYCIQPEEGGHCAGEWGVGYDAIVEAPEGSVFTEATGSCVAEGATLKCSAQKNAGSAAPFKSIVMPKGYQDLPFLGQPAVNGIRETHFEGGKKVDSSKGLFYESVTDDKLQAIFRAGLEDSNSAWELNKYGNYQKIFPYSGVGVTSKITRSLPSKQITLAITRTGGSVNTMYPS